LSKEILDAHYFRTLETIKGSFSQQSGTTKHRKRSFFPLYVLENKKIFLNGVYKENEHFLKEIQLVSNLK